MKYIFYFRFLTLFCNCLPQATVLRIWDLILLEGNEILLRTALAIWQALADRILSVRSADEFYCIMGVLTREMLEFGLLDVNALVKEVIRIGSLQELKSLREHYLHNLNPWCSNISAKNSSRDKPIKVHSREKLALDIGLLKKQYTKLKQRQRQAHIIFSAAVQKQPQNLNTTAVNHLLLGKTALVQNRKSGPPKGSIPPARRPPVTKLKDLSEDPSSSSSSDTELCDDPEDAFSGDEPVDAHEDVNLMKQDNINENSGENSRKLESLNEVHEDLLDMEDFNVPNLTLECKSETPNSATIQNEKFDFDLDKVSYTGSVASEDDFEIFLEERISCLKQSNFDESRSNLGRKNNEKALQIIHENSLILTRILQCQSRLSPSPSFLDGSDENMDNKTLNEIESDQAELDSKENESCFSELFSKDLYTSSFSSHKEKFFRREENQYEDDIVFKMEEETAPVVDDENICKVEEIGKVINPSKVGIYNEDIISDSKSIKEKFENLQSNMLEASRYLEEYRNEQEYKLKEESIGVETVEQMTTEEEDIEVLKGQGESVEEQKEQAEAGSKYSSILEYSKNLDEKYNDLILNRPTISLKDFSNKTNTCQIEDQKSPLKEEVGKPSKDEVNIPNLKSPNRIYNPFPVSVNSRQKKEVGVKLGMYKK